MGDEPRRSGRATKGQHKNLDLVPDAPSKKSRSKTTTKDKAAKPSAEPTPAPSEEEEIIRCICGEYEEEEDIERDMICCDQCSAWQHNDCMGLSFPKGEEPAEYYCEQCKPENHKELLDKIKRGEKPWEEAAKRRQQEVEEKKAARKKKGKKGKKGGARVSDARTIEGTPTSPAPPSSSAAATPAPAKEDEAKSSSTQKRKFDEHQESPAPAAGGPKQKQQRTASQANKVADQERKASPVQSRKAGSADESTKMETDAMTSEIAKSPEEIQNSARRSAATALIKLFVDQILEAQKQRAYKLPAGKSPEDVARPLGLSIEQAMYKNICGESGEPNDPYKSQLRTILFNVKKNASLRDRLLLGIVSPGTLSLMSTQDMASAELQQKDAEIKREAEKQHIIVQEEGPRIRRTHKGEEIVEDANQSVASEPLFSSKPARPAASEREESSDAPGGRSTSPKNSRQPDARDGRRQSSGAVGIADGDTTNFNGRSHSPGGGFQDRLFPEAPANLHQPLPTGKVQADEDIDKLLKDEEAESPPYSPKEYSDGDFIWQGRISMNPVADFTSSARHVGGADLSGRVPWNQLVPPTLVIDGRIDIHLASNYLCGLRFSQSTDVTVISSTAPTNPTDRAQFDKLFNYFLERKRYGVIGKHPLPAVKDTYIIPVEVGSTKLPEFIELLENNTIEDPVTDRLLLIVFVVKTNDYAGSTPSGQPTPSRVSVDHGVPTGSPLTATPQFGGVRAGSQPASLPSSNLDGTADPAHHRSPSQQTSLPSKQASSLPTPSQEPPLIGAAAAAEVLGPQAKAPAIEQMLQLAPNADVAQLSIVRDILVKNPTAANDYKVLMQALYQATSSA